MKSFRFSFSFVAVLLSSAAASAWWEDGHAIVAKVAENYLTAESARVSRTFLAKTGKGRRDQRRAHLHLGRPDPQQRRVEPQISEKRHLALCQHRVQSENG